MKKLTVAVLTVVMTLSTATLVMAQISTYSCALEGSQEVPPSGSPGTGSGEFILDESTNTFSWNIQFSGTTGSETGAHVHGPAAIGVNAGVQFALAAGSPKVGNTVLTAGQVADLKAGLFYVNIHTTTSPGGELRGQILATPDKVPANNALTLVLLVMAMAATVLVLRRRIWS